VSSPSNWHTPRYGLLCDRAEAGAMLLDELFSRRPGQVSFRALIVPGGGLNEIQAAADRSGYRCLMRPLERSLVVDIDGDWESYRGRLSGNLRRDLTRRRRRLAKLGSVTLDVDRDERRLRQALEIERRGWKGARGSAVLSRPETTAFYTEVARWAAAADRLRLAFLSVDAKPIAFHLALEDGDTYYPLKGGFDPAFAPYSPGNLMIEATLARAFELGLRRYELLGGADPYKLRWATSGYKRVLFQAFAPTFAGRMRRAAYAYVRPAARRAYMTLRRRTGN
jgi:CelD/BcsL family acetyltransferase involved in cellulose biosynthesis